jgi:VWFA-related protein
MKGHSTMTRYAVHFILACVLATPLQMFAQEDNGSSAAAVQSTTANVTPSLPAIEFTSKTELVLVPVVVSRNGLPVTGLKKEDFKVFENGKEQKVAIFEDIQADSSPVTVNKRRQPELQQFSNMQVDQRQPKRLVIIVLDLINTSFSDRAYARQQLVKYLSSGVDDEALVSLIALGRGHVRVLHDFTSRPGVLAAALNKALGSNEKSAAVENLPPDQSKIFESEVNRLSGFLEDGRFAGMPFGSSHGESMLTWMRVRETLDGLNLIAQAYAGIPGRKALIWATGGFPFQLDGSTMQIPSGRMERIDTQDLSSILAYYEETWRLMNNSNFAVYPLDLRGLVTTNITAADHVNVNARNPGRPMERRIAREMDTVSTFGTFADMTGGRAYYNTNDLARSFKLATQDSASYYLLAYYVDTNAAREKGTNWRKLKVKVDVSGVDVRARSGYFMNKATDATLKDEIDLALSSPLDFTGLPVTVRWIDRGSEAQGDAQAGRKKVKFEVILPPDAAAIDGSDNNAVSLKIVASARSSDATEVNGITQTITGHVTQETMRKMHTTGFTFKSDIGLPPGSYSVRFVVHDNLSGRTGSVAAPLTVN